jgi:hypothetical protein
VALVTAFGDPKTRARAHALGAEAVLDKPFRLGEIGELAARYLGVSCPSAAPWPSPMRDDSLPSTRRSGS